MNFLTNTQAPSFAAAETMIKNYLSVPNPSFLSVEWLDANVFITSAQIARLHKTCVAEETFSADDNDFMRTPSRESFLSVFLDGWRNHPLILAIAHTLDVNSEELASALFKPMWRRLNFPMSRNYDFITENLPRLESIASNPETRDAAIESYWALVSVARRRPEIAASLDTVKPHFPQEAEYLLAAIRGDADITQQFSSNSGPEEMIASVPNRLQQIAASARHDISENAKAIKAFSEWFVDNIDWQDGDLETIRGFDSADFPDEKYTRMHAASFLAVSLTEPDTMDALCDAIAESRRNAGAASSYLCQKAVDDANEAAETLAPPSSLEPFLSSLDDDDFRRIATLLDSRKTANISLARDALFAWVIEGFDSPDMVKVVNRFADDLDDVAVYMKIRCPHIDFDGEDANAPDTSAARTPEVYAREMTDIVGRFDDDWIGLHFFSSEKTRRRIDQHALSHSIAGIAPKGIPTTASLRKLIVENWWRRPFVKSLRDAGADQYAPFTHKHRNFTFFPDVRDAFDKEWKSIVRSPLPNSRIEAIVRAARIPDLFPANLAADAFIALMMEADQQTVREAVSATSEFDDYQEFLDMMENVRTASEARERELVHIDTLAATLPSPETTTPADADEAVRASSSPIDPPVSEPMAAAPPAISGAMHDAAWDQLLDAISADLSAARDAPDTAFVERLEAYIPVLRQSVADFARRKIPLFGEVKDRLLPIFHELIACLPNGTKADVVKTSLVQLTQRTEAVPSETAWTSEAMETATSLLADIDELHLQIKKSAAELVEATKAFASGYDMTVAGHAMALSEAIVDNTSRTVALGTTILSSVPDLAAPTSPAPVAAAAASATPAPLVDFDAPETPLRPHMAMVEAIDSDADDEAMDVADAHPPAAENPDLPDFSLAEAEIVRLVSERSFSLAYHLALAIESCGSTSIIPSADLRLAAAAPHLNLPAMQTGGVPAEIRRAVESSLASVQGELPVDDVGCARKLLIFSGAVGLALIGRDAAAAEIVRATALRADWNNGVHPLKQAIQQVLHGTFQIAIDRFRSIKHNVDATHRAEKARMAVLPAIERLGIEKFPNFNIGTQLVRKLTEPHSEIGEMREALRNNAADHIDAVREFATRYTSHKHANEAIQAANKALGSRTNKIVGSILNTLVSHIVGIAEACSEYAGAVDAAADTNEEGWRRQSQIRDSIMDAVRTAEAATRALHEDAETPLMTTAIDVAAESLAYVGAILDGDVATPAPNNHLFALHGSLATIPGLVFGTSWLPDRYDGESILNIMLADGVELRDLRKDTVSEAFFLTLVESRLKEGSFVAANTLIEMASRLGIGDHTLHEAMKRVEKATPQARDAAQKAISEAHTGLEAIERFGDSREQEEAAEQTARLDLIKVSNLPQIISADLRSETANPRSETLDISAVMRDVADIKRSTHGHMTRHRERHYDRIESLLSAGRISKEDALSVRKLIDADNIIIGASFLNDLEAGIELPKHAYTANIRLRALLPTVTDFAGTPDAMAAAAANARAGTNYGPLEFSLLPPGRRAAAANYLDSWIAMGERLRTKSSRGLNDGPETVEATLKMLRLAGIDIKGSPAGIATRQISGGRAVLFEMSGMTTPSDPEALDNLVLPDFGSRTSGRWRILVCETMPTSDELKTFAQPDNAIGRLVFVTAPVSTEERRRLAKECRDAKLKILVIDHAIALAGAAEPEMRAATLIEMAQPFSFSQPFADHGKAAVPPEMFVGRASEIQDIVDAMGTIFVYGGRRLGKTAALRHIATTRHNPAIGMVAVHIDIQFVGEPNRKPETVWREISTVMTDVFQSPVDNFAQFEARTRQWLDTRPNSRILLMLDEADKLIQADANSGYRVFNEFLKLMSDTNRRFKPVFAGLHNVTKLATGANSPVRQIAAKPVCFGPLLSSTKEKEEAEHLLTKPLAALGYEFGQRNHAWRILSHAGYIPATIQLFGRRFLEILRERPVDMRSAPPVVIDDDMITEAIGDRDIQDAINNVFTMTIENDPRYQLIANIVGNADCKASSTGNLDSHLTAVEICDLAGLYWPSEFETLDAQQIVDSMLEEMEGLGILKRIPDTARGGEYWLLRSPQVRRMLGDKLRIESKLMSFSKAKSPNDDINALRRTITSGTHNFPSPLTQRQENNIRDNKNIMLFVGNIAGGIHHAAEAIRATFDERRFDVVVADGKFGGTYELMVGHAKDMVKTKTKKQRVLLFPDSAEWTPDHLSGACTAFLNNKVVKHSSLQAIFVAGADKWQALRLGGDPRFEEIGVHSTLPSISSLTGWTDNAINAITSQFSLTLLGDELDKFKEVTGCFGTLAYDAMQHIEGRSDKISALDEWFDLRSREPGFIASLGIRGGVVDRMRTAVEYADAINTLKDARDVLYPDDATLNNTAIFLDYTRRLRLIFLPKIENRNALHPDRPVQFNPLVRKILPLLGNAKKPS